MVLVLLLLSVGVYLIVTSFRRKGDEPYCGKCGYSLTNSKALRCPECGNFFVDAGIVKGRKRGPGRLLIGLALIILVPVLVCMGLLTTGPQVRTTITIPANGVTLQEIEDEIDRRKQKIEDKNSPTSPNGSNPPPAAQ